MTDEEKIELWKKPEPIANSCIVKGAKIAKNKLEGKGKSGYNEDNHLDFDLSAMEGLRSAKLMEDYDKVYGWINKNIKEIAKIWKNEFGSKTITLCLYFIELKKEVHDCIQINFDYDNVILNVRQCRGGDYGAYFTCSLQNQTSPNKRFDIHSPSLDLKPLMQQFYSEFVSKLPPRQLENLTEVYPLFLSEFGSDNDQHLTVDLRFKEGAGMYSKLFVDQKERYRSYSYQPVYADKEREICTLIVRPEDCLDIYETINEIRRMGCTDKIDGEIKIIGRIDVEVDIEETIYAGGAIVACDPDVIVRGFNIGGIDNNIVRSYVYGFTNLIRVEEGSGVSSIVKGKKISTIEENIENHLSGMQTVALGTYNEGKNYPISHSNFGFNENIIYGETVSIPHDLADKIQNQYLKHRQEELKRGDS